MKPQPNCKLAVLILLCALFVSFLYIDDGIIGRLRTVNVVLLIVSVALTAVELIRHVRGKA